MFRKIRIDFDNKVFEIEEDFEDVGCYLRVYDSNGKCIKDYLQDNLEITKEFANEEFGIPISIWDRL